jgi:hypothetical protein
MGIGVREMKRHHRGLDAETGSHQHKGDNDQTIDGACERVSPICARLSAPVISSALNITRPATMKSKVKPMSSATPCWGS